MAMNLNTLGKTATLATRLADSHHATESLVTPYPQKQLCSCAPIQAPIPQVRPEDEGVPCSVLQSYLEQLHDAPSLNMHTVLVLRHGHIIAKAAYDEQSLDFAKSTFSACKSITALAVGMLCDRGQLHVSDKVLSFFSDYATPMVKLKHKSLTVEDLLTMRSTVTFAEVDAMAESDWIRAFFASTTQGEVGKTFHYNSLNTYILSAIVQRVTGETLFEFLKTRLFDPLAIHDVYWELSPEGISKGGWGLYIRPEDLAKVGQLVMNRGMWNGTTLISPEWIQEMTGTHVKDPIPGGIFDYGYQVWVSEEQDAFLFNGMLGQNVLGFRSTDVLVVSNAGNDEMFQQSAYFPITRRLLGQPFAEKTERDDDAYRALCRAVSGFVTGADLTGPLPIPPAAPAPVPDGLFARLRRKFRKTEAPAVTPVPAPAVDTPKLPAACAGLDGVTFLAESRDAPSCGLLPMILQVLQNNYTKGLVSIGFEQTQDAFFLLYGEADATYRVQIGFREPCRGQLTVHGEPYWVTCYGRFTENEDGVPVLVLRLCFPETACTRTIKLFLGADYILRQSERPGVSFIEDTILDILSGLAEKPLIGGAVSRVSEDYISYRVRSVFAPEIKLTKQENE